MNALKVILPHEESSPYGFGCDWHVVAKIKTRPRRRRRRDEDKLKVVPTTLAVVAGARRERA